jgi:hypothetical protein
MSPHLLTGPSQHCGLQSDVSLPDVFAQLSSERSRHDNHLFRSMSWWLLRVRPVRTHPTWSLTDHHSHARQSPLGNTPVLKPSPRARNARSCLAVGVRVGQNALANGAAAGASLYRTPHRRRQRPWKPSRLPWAPFNHGSVTSARPPKL